MVGAMVDGKAAGYGRCDKMVMMGWGVGSEAKIPKQKVTHVIVVVSQSGTGCRAPAGVSERSFPGGVLACSQVPASVDGSCHDFGIAWATSRPTCSFLAPMVLVGDTFRIRISTPKPLIETFAGS